MHTEVPEASAPVQKHLVFQRGGVQREKRTGNFRAEMLTYEISTNGLNLSNAKLSSGIFVVLPENIKNSYNIFFYFDLKRNYLFASKN